ncbi:hypothetical protein BRSU_0228 [Brachyspira suanatina]|uniref:Uncharacterized protein n=1 Tax=Brachyspira suanatina TaxID=381802 RepID=A0A0G4K3U6_9SPIR|nr:hypothetical protein [Brachyspira suanatina]CRF31563.1 hypothetical protein BRSU_0228 [Brachyspira suanatina]
MIDKINYNKTNLKNISSKNMDYIGNDEFISELNLNKYKSASDEKIDINNQYSNSISNANSKKYSMKREVLDNRIDNYDDEINNTITRKDGGLKETSVLNEQGNVSETHHKETFNIDSAAQGRENKTHAEKTKYGDPTTDIRVTDGDNTKDYQLKYEKDPKSNVDSLSNPKYSGGDKVAPSDQVDDIKRIASNKTNTENKDYAHTSENTYDRISSEDGKVNSDPLTRDEAIELTEKARKGEKIEYKYADEKRNIQFRNQLLKSTLLGGAFAAGGALFGEIMKLIDNGGNLTEDEFIQGFFNVVSAGVDGASKSALAVSLHYLGKNIGSSILSNPYVGGGIAVVTIDTLKSLYKFAIGQINDIELIGDVSKNIIQTTTTSVGAFAGSTLASSISSLVISNMTMSAAAAATFSTIATVVGSVLGGLAFGLTTAYLIDLDSKAGIEIAKRDIEEAYEEFKKDKNLYQLVDKIGTQKDWEFSIKSLILFGGTFAQISECCTRSQGLKNISSHLDKQYSYIDEAERRAINNIKEKAAIIEDDMKQKFYANVKHMFQNDVVELHNDLMNFLNAKRNILALNEKKYINELKCIDEDNAALQERAYRDELFYDEVNNLIEMIEKSDIEVKENIIGVLAYIASEKFSENLNSDIRDFYELLIEDNIINI